MAVGAIGASFGKADSRSAALSCMEVSVDWTALNREMTSSRETPGSAEPESAGAATSSSGIAGVACWLSSDKLWSASAVRSTLTRLARARAALTSTVDAAAPSFLDMLRQLSEISLERRAFFSQRYRCGACRRQRRDMVGASIAASLILPCFVRARGQPKIIYQANCSSQ